MPSLSRTRRGSTAATRLRASAAASAAAVSGRSRTSIRLRSVGKMIIHSRRSAFSSAARGVSQADPVSSRPS